jgi:hypothetical protein
MVVERFACPLELQSSTVAINPPRSPYLATASTEQAFVHFTAEVSRETRSFWRVCNERAAFTSSGAKNRARRCASRWTCARYRLLEGLLIAKSSAFFR